MRTMPVFLFLVVALLAAPPFSSAQDARWQPWYGCWERVTDRMESVPEDDAAVADEPAPVTGEAPRVCVEPAGDNAVTMTTTVPGQDALQERLVADGMPHPISEGGCEGTETLEWSGNGQRLFARAEVTCAGGSTRTVSGLALITPDDTWIDIRSVRLGEVPSTRVSRYRRVDEPQSLRLPRVGGPPLTLAEVKEAAGKVADEVLEAALVETNPRLPVRADTLVDLAEAGVSPAVIDLVVALAFPDRFVVERTGQIATISERGTSRRYGLDDYYYSGFYYPAYYYSPFGYSYLGFYDPFLFGSFYGYPRGIPVIPAPDGAPPARGRAIAGQGYTRIRPAGDDDGTAPRTATPRGGTRSTAGDLTGGRASGGGSGSSGSSGSSSGGSSSGGSSSGASPEGYSGGGSGRTAQPR